MTTSIVAASECFAVLAAALVYAAAPQARIHYSAWGAVGTGRVGLAIVQTAQA